MTLTAMLSTSTGAPLAGKTLKFTLNGRSTRATTGSDGVASAKLTTPTTPGTYSITIDFAGDTTDSPSSTTFSGFTVT